MADPKDTSGANQRWEDAIPVTEGGFSEATPMSPGVDGVQASAHDTVDRVLRSRGMNFPGDTLRQLELQLNNVTAFIVNNLHSGADFIGVLCAHLVLNRDVIAEFRKLNQHLDIPTNNDEAAKRFIILYVFRELFNDSESKARSLLEIFIDNIAQKSLDDFKYDTSYRPEYDLNQQEMITIRNHEMRKFRHELDVHIYSLLSVEQCNTYDFENPVQLL